MEIQYLGHSCFRIKSKNVVVITDPFFPAETGLKFPKTSADIVTVSHQHQDHNNISGVSGTPSRPQPFIINEPGEYEIAGVSIFGLSSFGENTIFVINFDGLRIVHLGDLGHKLDEVQLEEINGTDVLFIPVGGIHALDSQKAVEVVAQVEPKIVIPMHYLLPNLKFKLAPVKDFLKEIAAEESKPLDKLVLAKENLSEERQVVVLNARS